MAPGLTELRPILATVFGDVILQGPDAYWFLDTMQGCLTREWDSAGDLNAVLASPEGQDRYLLAGLAFRADERGVARTPGQVYVFAPHPVLSGKFDVDTIMAMDLTVALSISSHVHQQVRATQSPDDDAGS